MGNNSQSEDEEYLSAASSTGSGNSELDDSASDSEASDSMQDTSQSHREFESEARRHFEEFEEADQQSEAADRQFDEANGECDEADEECDENDQEYDEDDQEYDEEDQDYDEEYLDYDEDDQDYDEDDEYDEDEQETGTEDVFDQNAQVDNEVNAGDSGTIFDFYGDCSDAESFRQRLAKNETPAEPSVSSKDTSSPTCPVCMESFAEVANNGSFFVTPPCGHGMCYKCAWGIKKTDIRRFVCPVCRKACEHQNVHRLFF